MNSNFPEYIKSAKKDKQKDISEDLLKLTKNAIKQMFVKQHKDRVDTNATIQGFTEIGMIDPLDPHSTLNESMLNIKDDYLHT